MPDQTAPPEPPKRGKFATWLLQGGIEPDPRLTLANERTFLAWIRMSLALLAGGIAVEAFTANIFIPTVRKPVAVLLLVLAIVIGCTSFFRWLRVERAMRRQSPLPLPVIAPLLAIVELLWPPLCSFSSLRVLPISMAFSRWRKPMPRHDDAGLQPERTSLTWDRTAMAMVIVSALFLRWAPEHRGFTAVLIAASLCSALGISVTQRKRYRRAVTAAGAGALRPDVIATVSVTAIVVVLGFLGVVAVVFLPLRN